MLVQIPGTSLFRDTETMALVNKDRNGLDEYMKKRNLLMTQRDEINNIKSEINSLKTDMSDIKKLLVQLLEKE